MFFFFLHKVNFIKNLLKMCVRLFPLPLLPLNTRLKTIHESMIGATLNVVSFFLILWTDPIVCGIGNVTEQMCVIGHNGAVGFSINVLSTVCIAEAESSKNQEANKANWIESERINLLKISLGCVFLYTYFYAFSLNWIGISSNLWSNWQC